MEQPFLPILLGSDMNAYGMARAFYEAYGIKPLVLGRSHLTATQDSSILHFKANRKFKRTGNICTCNGKNCKTI